jgi:hypothetical protein
MKPYMVFKPSPKVLEFEKRMLKSESQGKIQKIAQNCTWRTEENNCSVKTGIKSSLRKEALTNTSKYQCYAIIEFMIYIEFWFFY